MVNNHILKAGEIVTELMLALNLEQGGEVANNLLGIYVYIKKRLLEANMKKDSEIIQEIIKYMEDLKSAWEEIEKKEKSNVVSAPFQSSNRGSGLSIQG